MQFVQGQRLWESRQDLRVSRYITVRSGQVACYAAVITGSIGPDIIVFNYRTGLPCVNAYIIIVVDNIICD